jgi:DNA-binding response OmpR family regulator
MKRFLLIDQDTAAMQGLGLQCLQHDVGVVMAENMCEGVRVLLSTPVSLIVIDGAQFRLTPAEQATLLSRVAPGIPVVVLLRSDVSLESLVAHEVAGFIVKTRPVAVEDLLAKAGAIELR